MIVFFGTRQYGKVDHVPGLFYVATNFFYVQFIPLVPTGSVLVIDDGSQRAMSLGLHGKSVLFGYFRAASVVGGVLAMIFGVIGLAENDLVAGAILIGLGLLGILLFLLSYKLGKANAERAVHLAVKAGIPPEVVAQYFVDAEINPDDFPVQEVQEEIPADEDRKNFEPQRHRDTENTF
jgi:hypothetical protein